MWKSLNLVFLLIVVNIYGQELNTDYWELKKSLIDSQMDLVVEYSIACPGTEFIDLEDENCVHGRPYYLFWAKDGKYFKRKFSNCSLFNTNEIGESDFLITVIKNLNTIKNAKLLPVEHKSDKNSKGEVETVHVDIDHSCESKFIFYKGAEKIEKRLNHFYLETKMIDENTPNDNYELNQKSILGTIFKQIQQETLE